MEHRVNTYLTAGTIISSLGFDTAENMDCIRRYRSGIARGDDPSLFVSPFMAARIDEERLRQAVAGQGLESYTRMEQLFILSLLSTIRQSGIDPSSTDCGIILSTTKGNIDLLSDIFHSRKSSFATPATPLLLPPQKHCFHTRNSSASETLLYTMANRISGYFHCVNEPIVISNACISGVSALVVASRLIESGKYTQVLVAGGDLLTRFVVTGFQSFKSVSPEMCRPYDQSRDGLSLGEACGALLVTSDRNHVVEERPVLLKGGAITNDANHISGPSRTGDGLYYAIRQALDEAGLEPGGISFVNAHGTATPYNDEMESKALHWAGLDQLPMNSMKSYWGHTLGASGVIETIACLEELRSGEVFGTLGYKVCGVPFPLNISDKHRIYALQSCVKTASGFGGCNAAVVLSLNEEIPLVEDSTRRYEYELRRQVIVQDAKIRLDGQVVFEAASSVDFATFIRAAYKSLEADDRKFYKMDDLCKLGYIAAAALFAQTGGATGYEPGEVGLILANASSSLDTDLKHQQIIDTMGDQEASPAVFVYTLPNVVMGELCIRYKIQGENTFFISDRYPESFIGSYARQVMRKRGLRACLVGWCELLGETYEARFDWLERVPAPAESR